MRNTDFLELHGVIEEKQSNICQITAYKSGVQVYDDTWNGYSSDDCVHVASVTKSIMSLLTGIALGQGHIKSVDDKVLDYFPEYSVKRGEHTIQEVTIRHLLTMRAPYNCKGDPWTRVCCSDNWTYTSLDLLGGRKGLTDEFSYQTVCLHILSGILYRATGIKTADYANEYLFRPLGIRDRVNFVADTAEKHKEFTISKLPKEAVWFSDPEGLGTPGYGLCMSAQELAKIGLLCLNKGMYEGKQIVPCEWIDEMKRPREVEGRNFRGMQYGYLWWIIDSGKGIYAAIGNSGNVIYIDPEKDVVVGLTAYFKPTVMDRVDFIQEHVVPAIDR